MKICNNCSAVNHIAAVKCVQCHMPNNFTLQDVTAATQHPESRSVICTNCGSTEPGDGYKCVHCRFPLPAQPRSGHFKEERVVRGRAIGDSE